VVLQATTTAFVVPTSARTKTVLASSVEDVLQSVSSGLKLEVFDLDEGAYGLAATRRECGIEVVNAKVATSPALGLELTEMARGGDGRGLVLVSGVSGNAQAAGLRVGDALTFARGGAVERRLTALDYDLTVSALRECVSASDVVTVEANRLVERAPVRVEYELPAPATGSGVVEALAGENLRKLLLRSGLTLYDPKTKRFDQPYATGDCAGEGICGTCLVKVVDGASSLSPRDPTEELITRGRPRSWRAACRCVVGADNTPATLKIALKPQSAFDDELNPGVKPLS